MALALGLWTLLWGSARGGVGRKQAYPASPAPGGQMGQEWAGAAAPTWPVTHSQDTHSWVTHVEMQMCMCVHTHRVHPHMCTPSSHKTHSQLTHAHTITHVHTYPAPPAQGLTLTVCTHLDAYRQRQGHAYTQLTHAGIQAHPTHTQTHPCTYKSHTDATAIYPDT